MKISPQLPTRKQGFALVVTLSLLILLTLVAVGLLSLSSVTLRTSGHTTAQQAAQANARLALSLAIAQLQKETGPDQRITTLADQRSSGDGSQSSAAEGRRHWTGVYRSWPATERTRPDPEFLGWLVSGEPNQLAQVSTVDAAGSGGNSIELVGAGTLGSAAEGRVEVPTVEIASADGTKPRIAWWTGDQGIKAAVSTPPMPKDNALAMVRSASQSAPRNALELVSIGTGKPFDGVDEDDARLTRVTSWQQSALLATDPQAPRPLFHDLAPFSTGLLTNVRTGGFRKDLSMALERPTVTRAPRTPLYSVGGEPGINFQEIWAYYNSYKELYRPRTTPTYTTGGRFAASTPRFETAANISAAQNDDWFFYKQPVIVSYQMALSLTVRQVSDGGQTRNRVHVVADPIITLWNPLDVPVIVPTSGFFSVKYWQVPYDVMISRNGTSYVRYPLRTIGGGDGNYLSLRAGEAQQLVFKPGEVIKVSQTGNTLVRGGADHNLQGRAGFNFGGGVALPLRTPAGQFLDLTATDRIAYELRPNNLTSGKKGASGNSLSGNDEHTRHFSLTHHEFYLGTDRGSDSLGIGGMYLDWDFGDRRLRPGQTRGDTQAGTKFSAAPRLYADRFPNIFKSVTSSEAGPPLTYAELDGGRKTPIVLLSYNAKTELDTDLGTRFLARYNPKVLHVDFFDLTEKERLMLPYEFVVSPLYGQWRNRHIESTTTGNGFYGGGMNAEFGTSFVSTHSVPREPIVSLGALQHSFANGFEFLRPLYGYATLHAREPMLPQIGHAIGNSLAPPMMEPSQTEGTLPGRRPMADHSYLSNLALWDDWFFSGIAPQTVLTYGTNRRPQRTVADEFFKGTGTLPVSRYLPEISGADPAQLLSEFFSGANPTDAATDKVASLIRVDGLFNVNSTSVEAWKAMLGSLKGRSVVVRNANGEESLAAADEATPVANLHSPRDLIIKNADSVKNHDQWIGRRTLEEQDIDQLARAIVKEVRKRGPFLSLADFVNRRPGSNTDLARAGTIQNALDSEEVQINASYRNDRAVATNVAGKFTFPDAEKGPLSYGSPGVVKQADILTPIAPVLSARSDSFIIRAYGESVNRFGKVLARAWCEAVVERDKNFVDTTDKPETVPTNLTREANRTFGRRYIATSFRWLHPDEV
jgi:hypothetical protein